MSSEKMENPVLLWGDMGPDVYLLSQIYDPRNDRYIETQDTSVIDGKDYYERLNLILTTDTEIHPGRVYWKRTADAEGVVTFTPVEILEEDTRNPAVEGWYMDSGGKIYVFSKVDLSKYSPTVNPRNPKGEDDNYVGWYEVNEDAQNACGKYVPAVYSPVVVDDVECDYKTENHYKTRMLLMVKSVDAAFNVTFVPFEFGINPEETTRAIDYGNEKFYLFFDRKAGDRNILLTPDRKLMLYGKNTYGYRIKREGAIISSNLPTIQTRDDAFIPYVRAIGKRCVITEENFEKYVGSYLDVILPNGLQRVICVPKADELILTSDITFRAANTYYTADGTKINTDGLVNKVIDDQTEYDVGIVGPDGKPRLFSKFYTRTPDPDGGWIYTKATGWFEPDVAYYVEVEPKVYHYAITNKLTGAKIIDYESDPSHSKVFRYAKEDLISRVCYNHDNPDDVRGSVFLPERCYLKSAHSIVEGEVLTFEVFAFDYLTREANLIMSVDIIAKEATALDTTDVTTRQIVRFDVELNGQEAGDIWYLQQGDDWRQVFNVVPKISFDDGSDMTIPVDGKTCYRYGFENIKSNIAGREYSVLFKFFPHKTLNVDWQKIGLTPTKNFLSVRKTVKIVSQASQKIRKISLIPAWNHEIQEYELYYMIFKTDFMAPPIIRQGLDTRYTMQVFVPTTDTHAIEDPETKQVKRYYQKLNSGRFQDLNLVLGADVPEHSYEGTYELKTTIEDVKFMNNSGQIEYIPAASAGGNFGVIQRAVIAERVSIDNLTASAIYTQPILFKLAMMNWNTDPFKWLIGDDKSGYEFIEIPYGKAPRPFLRYKIDHIYDIDGDGTKKEVTIDEWERGLYPNASVVGAYRIDAEKFTEVAQVIEAFYTNAHPPHGVPEEGEAEVEDFEPTHFYIRACSDDSACSGFIPLRNPADGDGGLNYQASVLMTGGGRADEVPGGAIPIQIDDHEHGQGQVNLMGTVIVEFVQEYTVEHLDGSKDVFYRHLYAVPVEVLKEGWPRVEEEEA